MLQLSRLRDFDDSSPPPATDFPVPGSGEELLAFERLQQRLIPLFQDVFPNPRAPRSVVVVPSLSMDEEFLTKIEGVEYYEERMLCLLMLLRLPRTRLIIITSRPIDPAIIAYYLHLLPGIPATHARRRLTLLSCHDATSRPLSYKILQRPRLMQRIRAAIPNAETAHITCFNATALERTLAVRLGIPLYSTDPALGYLGTKSGSREVFKAAGALLPDGFEHLRDLDDLVGALADLKRRNPDLRRAVVKHEEGASGEGNALFSYEGAPGNGELAAWIRRTLPHGLRFEARQETWERYLAKFEELGGIAECFIEGQHKRSPSVQCRIDPLGHTEIVSTHDQVLGGPSGQIFLGCTFPADKVYRLDVQEIGFRIGTVLQQHRAIGRFGVDFISVRERNQWQHYAIEINLRKGGTTHPFLMLQFLTDGLYDTNSGCYYTPTGRARFYFASDNLQSPSYRGLTPDDLIDIAVEHGLHFHGATQQGVVFHLIGALSQFGKLGLLCIADSHARAQQLYQDTVTVLDREAEMLAAARGPVLPEIVSVRREATV